MSSNFDFYAWKKGNVEKKFTHGSIKKSIFDVRAI